MIELQMIVGVWVEKACWGELWIWIKLFMFESSL